MKIYSIIKVTPESQSFESQKEDIKEHLNQKKIKIDCILQVVGKHDKSYLYNLDKSLEKILNNETIIINDLSVFGQSIFNILRYLRYMNLRNITLYIIDLDKWLNKQNDESLFILLFNLLKIQENKIQERTSLAKNTKEKKGTKLGRKSGKPTKSMFDEHKTKIKKLYDLGLSKKKIIEHIGIGTAQSLSVYIKKKRIHLK
jgi:DNA invertase Pin-like site-specific DNA recombinase